MVNRRAQTEQKRLQLEEFFQYLSIRLLLWSLLVVVTGVILLLLASSFAYGFGLGLLSLGLLELGLSVWASFSARRPVATLQPSVMDARARWLRRLLLGCLLLCLLLLGGSLALALGLPNDLWRGLGWGLFAQAAFLLYFTWFHARKVPKLA